VHANAFDGEDADTAILLTAHLGVLLSLASMTAEANTRALQLADAVSSRDVIGQAKGILMERERLTAGQAFDVLRAASQRLNRKLRDVAEHLATSGELAAGP
jgi:AmiR/NasT family two-component response regulator